MILRIHTNSPPMALVSIKYIRYMSVIIVKNKYINKGQGKKTINNILPFLFYSHFNIKYLFKLYISSLLSE